MLRFLCLFMLGAQFGLLDAYKPVIFMHGIFSEASEASWLFQHIQESHPGTKTLSVDLYNNFESLENMNTQVTKVAEVMLNFMKDYPDGVNLICYSQGGLICRGVLERNKHNVDTFVALSSPLAGQFGDTDFLNWLYPKYLKENIFKFFYTEEGQKISIANYWNDPHKSELYKNISTFLAPLNADVPNPNSQENKKNFVSLKKLVLIGGPDDGVITPWQSSHFGFYDEHEKVVDVKEQKWYKDDLFGLRTLDERKSMFIHVVPGVEHLYWYRNATVFKNYVLPYLT